MASKQKENKMLQSTVEEDAGIKLHTNNCDKLYRWSMWRMYLNEELSRVISAKRDHADQSNTTYTVTSPYTKHPDGKRYGRQMKKLFRRGGGSVSETTTEEGWIDILPDSTYLVFGLPRISLDNRAPENVRQLHASVSDFQDVTSPKVHTSSGGDDTDISEMFKFISHNDATTSSDSRLSRVFISQEGGTSSSDVNRRQPRVARGDRVDKPLDSYKLATSVANSNCDITADEIHSTGTAGHSRGSVDANAPLVSKSRLFWQILASKTSEIIDTGRVPGTGHGNHSSEQASISEEILLKQQQLLKRPMLKKRSSRDLWRSLAERKTEILQMRELDEAANTTTASTKLSKPSQLWSFIFSRKKDLIQMKRGMKGGPDGNASRLDDRCVGKYTSNDHCSSKYTSNDRCSGKYTSTDGGSGPVGAEHNPTSSNFENSFQKELLAKLKGRKEAADPLPHNVL